MARLDSLIGSRVCLTPAFAQASFFEDQVMKATEDHPVKGLWSNLKHGKEVGGLSKQKITLLARNGRIKSAGVLFIENLR